MADFLTTLAKKLKKNSKTMDNYHRIYVHQGVALKRENSEPLRVNILFKHIQAMLSGIRGSIAKSSLFLKIAGKSSRCNMGLLVGQLVPPLAPIYTCLMVYIGARSTHDVNTIVMDSKGSGYSTPNGEFINREGNDEFHDAVGTDSSSPSSSEEDDDSVTLNLTSSSKSKYAPLLRAILIHWQLKNWF